MSDGNDFSSEDIDAHEARIAGVFRRAFDEHGWTPAQDRTPLDEMLGREPELDEGLLAAAKVRADRHGVSVEVYLSRLVAGEIEANPDGVAAEFYPNGSNQAVELRSLRYEEAVEVADWARKELFLWLFGSGPHPFRLLQRVYAMAFARFKEVLGPLNMAWLATILGQGRAAFEALFSRLFEDVVVLKEGIRMKVTGQKSAASSAIYAENAREHCPKRQLNGDAGGAGPTKAAQEAKVSREARDRLAQAKSAAAARDLERDAKVFLERVKR